MAILRFLGLTKLQHVAGGACSAATSKMTSRPSRRSKDATEFIKIEASGNTVAFDLRFFLNDGECRGSSGHEVTVADGLITLYTWGIVILPSSTARSSE